jgi:hypothetical protein
LHYEIVFKLVTTIDEIQKRERELQINYDYVRALPKEIKDMSEASQEEEYKGHEMVPQELWNKVLVAVQEIIAHFICSFYKTKYDNIKKITSLNQSLLNQIKNEAQSKIVQLTKTNKKSDDLDFNLGIKDPVKVPFFSNLL